MNWSALISELEARGLTQAEIANRAGCSQPYVSQLKAGARKRPHFEIGQALVAMHKQRKPKTREVRAS